MVQCQTSTISVAGNGQLVLSHDNPGVCNFSNSFCENELKVWQTELIKFELNHTGTYLL
jgi:hypothetical protein